MTKNPPSLNPAGDAARAWQRTVAAELPPASGPRLPTPRREAIQGLDVRELESQTVFDQLFGDAAPKPAR